jgi:dephospho-CoA kinase
MLNARLEEYRRQGVEVVVLEAAVIIEAGRNIQVDELWVITAPEATVIDRIAERPDYSEESSRKRIRSQLTNEERIKHADVIIDNDCPLDELKAKVFIEWEKLLQRI